MKTVLATGVFEIIHPGHLLFLRQARKLGDRLVVIVARDVHVTSAKRRPHIPEQQRLEVVSQLKPVDEALLGEVEDIYAPLKRIKPDVVALGADQDIDVEELGEKIRCMGLSAEIVRVSEYWGKPLHSSSQIIHSIREKR